MLKGMDMDQQNDNYIKKSFDVLPEDVLRWYPWVGENYSKTKILIVGESHYGVCKETLEWYLKSKEGTIEVIKALITGKKWAQDNKTLNNFSKSLVGDNDYTNEVLWNKLAYYNFIQRPMNYISPNKERPTNDDFIKGCKTFKQVINILKPSICIFIGVEASWRVICSFEQKDSNRDCHISGKLNRINLRPIVTVNMPYGQTKLIFTKHSSRYYNWSGWHNYLKQSIPNEIKILSDKV